MRDLKDKTIIVTGAASGIGKAIVLRCIELGASVIAIDVNDAGLKALENQLSDKKIYIYTADVSQPDKVRHVFSAISKADKYPDSLINNAGIYYGKSILKYCEEEINRVLEVNIKSAIYCSNEFARHKLQYKEKGSIINISSVSAHEGSSDAMYGLTKAAIIGLTKSNALNFSPFIRVNAVAPGVVETPMMDVIPKERLNTYKENELLKESIDADDVADTVVFLISDISGKHYTGAIFDINNGCYIR